MTQAATPDELATIIGRDAAAACRRYARFMLAAFVVGFLTAVPVTVSAQDDAHGNGLVGLAALMWTIFAVLVVAAWRASRRCGHLAAAYLSADLGFSVPPRAFNTAAGWQAFIEREQRWHAEGRRPRFYVGSRYGMLAQSRATRKIEDGPC